MSLIGRRLSERRFSPSKRRGFRIRRICRSHADTDAPPFGQTGVLMKKNELYQLNIESVTLEGSGVGYADSTAVFVPFAAIGDTVSVKIVKVCKGYAFGRIEGIIKPSEKRIEPDCPAYGKCGGCAFRHLSYKEELRVKRDAVYQALRRIGGIEDPAVEPIVGGTALTGFRNKAQYPATVDENGRVSFGFFARRSHRAVTVSGCGLQAPVFNDALECVADWATEEGISVYDEATGKGVLRHIFLRYAEATDQLLVMPVINSGKLPLGDKRLAKALYDRLGDSFHSLLFNINTADTNVVLGKKCVPVYGEPFITDIVCGIRLRVSPLAFSQTNRAMSELLYGKAGSFVPDGTGTLIDLYCGGGAIGLTLAGRVERLIGVEIVPSAVEDARCNAAANGITNAEFICGDAAKAASELKTRGIHADAVILDPPRKGCDAELLGTVAQGFRPERIIYVSCNPATLARDVKALTGMGYAFESAAPFDLFPRTAHVESVVLMSRA